MAMTTSTDSNTEPEFDWSEKLQGVILGSQFYLYIIGPTIAGNFTDRVGAKWVNFLGAIVPCILSLLTPIGVRKGGVGVLIAIRTIDGLFHSTVYASLFSLYIRWFSDPGERAIANGATFFGGCLGSTVMYSLAGWACSTEIGWPLVYYINAALYLPWMILWIVVVSNDPAENRFISEEELAVIKVSEKKRGVLVSSLVLLFGRFFYLLHFHTDQTSHALEGHLHLPPRAQLSGPQDGERLWVLSPDDEDAQLPQLSAGHQALQQWPLLGWNLAGPRSLCPLCSSTFQSDNSKASLSYTSRSQGLPVRGHARAGGLLCGHSFA